MSLVTSLASLLTRLKYSMDLTKLVKETALSLSLVNTKAECMVALDRDIDLATRQRDVKRYEYIAVSEREFDR